MSIFDDNRHLYCRYCKNDTNHTCVGRHINSHVCEEPDETGYYLLWICDGCEHPTLEITRLDYERERNGEINYLPYFEESEEDAIFYPSLFQYLPKSFHQIPKHLDKLYNEIISALNSDAPILCAVGIRVLIEGICAEKNIQGRNLATKIDGLSEFLTPNIINALHGIRFLGNTAAHELTPPPREEILLALNICEDVLNFLYDLDYKAGKMASTQSVMKLFKPNKSE